jgi:hypothetical protein
VFLTSLHAHSMASDAGTVPITLHFLFLGLQLFTGLCYALLGPDGKVSKSVHLALNEPRSAPMYWTGFARGSG